MAKLTTDQKAINKEAIKLRNQAYAERKKDFRLAIRAIESKMKESEQYKKVESLRAAIEAVCATQNSAESILKAQIQQLELQLADSRKVFGDKVTALRLERDAAWNAYKVFEDTEKLPVKELYADLDGPNLVGASAWKSFEEFVPLVVAKQ